MIWIALFIIVIVGGAFCLSDYKYKDKNRDIISVDRQAIEEAMHELKYYQKEVKQISFRITRALDDIYKAIDRGGDDGKA